MALSREKIVALFDERLQELVPSLALDGRIARTLPRLLFRPGSLSRDYSEDKRSRYVPPFRLFLLSSLLFYLVVFAFVESSGIVSNIDLVRQGEARALNAEERAAVVEFITQNGKVDDEELEADELEAEKRAEHDPALSTSHTKHL